MSKERVLLERAYGELAASDTTTGLLKEIRDFLSTPEPTQDEEPVGQVGKCHTVTWFKKPEPLTYLFLHPAPRKPFVRLSEGSIFNEWNVRLHQFEISNIYNAFLHGVRFAEKHHGIGGGE